MKLTRMESIQREIVERYDNISNLYVAYMNCGRFSDEFGREFFHAVGEVLQGKSIKQLTLFHLDSKTVDEIVNHTLPKGGIADKKRDKKNKKKQPSKKRKTPQAKNKRRKNFC